MQSKITSEVEQQGFKNISTNKVQYQSKLAKQNNKVTQ